MNNKTKHSLLTYLFLLLTIFIIFIFTKNFYTNIVENKDKIKSLNDQIKIKSDEYNKIAKIKSEIESGTIKNINFDKFLINFSEDELLDYFYTYANNHANNLKIESLNLSKGKLNEFGFNEATINLQVTFNSEQDMIDMINFLLRSEKYNLYIHDFTYPLGSDLTSPLKVKIPLKILYK